MNGVTLYHRRRWTEQLSAVDGDGRRKAPIRDPLTDIARSPRRGGFSLVEVLVVLIILALLTAAVFPIVLQQIGKADPTRISMDLDAIKTGVQNFRLDMRPEFPGDLEDLVYSPSSVAETSVNGTVYGSLASNWNGPYIDSGLAESTTAQATGDAIATGFSGQIQNDIVCFNKATNVASATTCARGTHSVAVRIDDLTTAQYDAVDLLIDGAVGTSAGNFRRVTGPPTDAYYLVSPYN